MKNSKFQTPNSSQIPDPKSQALPSVVPAQWVDLKFGTWSFFGAWNLELGFSLLFGVCCLVLLSGASAARAQSYSIDWFTIDGGGGSSTGGVYQVSGTIGQPDAGPPMTGGNFSLTGGFWSLLSVVQTPGAPTLTITRSGASVTVSWPSPSTGFILQQNNNLNNSAGWSAFGGTINDNGTIKTVTISPPTGNLYFRLKQ